MKQKFGSLLAPRAGLELRGHIMGLSKERTRNGLSSLCQVSLEERESCVPYGNGGAIEPLWAAARGG